MLRIPATFPCTPKRRVSACTAGLCAPTRNTRGAAGCVERDVLPPTAAWESLLGHAEAGFGCDPEPGCTHGAHRHLPAQHRGLWA